MDDIVDILIVYQHVDDMVHRYLYIHMEVSRNGGTPKSFIFEIGTFHCEAAILGCPP